MTNENNQTLEERTKEFIDKEFPYPSMEEHYHNPNHKASIKAIKHNCARASVYSSIDNSLSESWALRYKAVFKTIWTAGLAVGAAYLVNNYKELSDNLQFYTFPAVAFTLYQLKLNLLGRHVFTGVGTYYKSPYFSILDDFKLGNNWKKIARMQKEGKLPHGEK